MEDFKICSRISGFPAWGNTGEGTYIVYIAIASYINVRRALTLFVKCFTTPTALCNTYSVHKVLTHTHTHTHYTTLHTHTRPYTCIYSSWCLSFGIGSTIGETGLLTRCQLYVISSSMTCKHTRRDVICHCFLSP